jgi:hypothetical protein
LTAVIVSFVTALALRRFGGRPAYHSHFCLYRLVGYSLFP